MSNLYSIIITAVFLIVLPFIYGQIWKNMITDNLFFTYLSGFITILSIFQILGVPMVFGFVPFHIQVVVFNLFFLITAVFILYYNRSQLIAYANQIIKLPNKLHSYIFSINRYEMFYCLLLIALVAIEVYFTAFYDIGVRRSDDGYYAVLSSAAIHDDGLFLTDTTSGTYLHDVNAKYGLCGIFVFYTYISYITKLGVAIIQQSICSVLLVLMATAAFYLLSKFIFEENNARDNRLMFLVILSLIFLFGLHSAYSLSFRFLGPIWQGKAILAVVITPFLFATYPQIITSDFSIKKIFFLIVFSIATISLTLGGIIVIVVIPGVITALFVLKVRKLNYLLYLPFIWVMPTIVMLIYIFLNVLTGIGYE